MIYLYKSISPQAIESLHAYVSYFFIELFRNKHGKYDQDKLIHKDFSGIIVKNYLGIKDLLGQVYLVYSRLLANEKVRVKLIYEINNKIVDISTGKVDPFKYEDLPIAIQEPIRALYDREGILWSLISTQKPNKEIEAKCKTLKYHFDSFRKVNWYTVCPFCGIEGLLSDKDDDYKEDYDHQLAKSKYPFVSINFQNLFPCCEKCNRKYKGTDDLVFTSDTHPKEHSFTIHIQ